MKKMIAVLIALLFLAQPVSAMDFTAPAAPESAQKYMPQQQENFAQGLWYIIKTAISKVQPEITQAFRLCLSVVVAVLLVSIMNSLCKISTTSVRLVGAVVIGLLLLQPFNSMIKLGTNVINEVSDYGKLLLPVMTAAVSAQGGVSSSAAIYTATVLFNALLTTLITRLIVPGVYVYLCLCIASSAIEGELLKKLCDFVKWIATGCLKWVLYIFTGYISITGVISGVVDSSALKAAKMAISGAVPVVGGILSNATETILLSAGVMKSAAGVYGIFAVLAICIGPFLQIGIQYLLLKLTGAICNLFGYKPAVSLLQDFSSGMGIALAMTGTVCVLLLISLVCFMKGMN